MATIEETHHNTFWQPNFPNCPVGAGQGSPEWVESLLLAVPSSSVTATGGGLLPGGAVCRWPGLSSKAGVPSYSVRDTRFRAPVLPLLLVRHGSPCFVSSAVKEAGRSTFYLIVMSPCWLDVCEGA